MSTAMEHRMKTSTAIFPTRTYISLVKPEENIYYRDDLAYYVVQGGREGTTRVVSGYHPAGSEHYWELGQLVSFYHDQTGRDFGLMRVIGRYAKGVADGEIPTRKLPLSVIK